MAKKIKRSAGPAAQKGSMAKKPAGRSVLQPKGRESITTGYPAGPVKK